MRIDYVNFFKSFLQSYFPLGHLSTLKARDACRKAAQKSQQNQAFEEGGNIAFEEGGNIAWPDPKDTENYWKWEASFTFIELTPTLR